MSDHMINAAASFWVIHLNNETYNVNFEFWYSEFQMVALECEFFLTHRFGSWLHCRNTPAICNTI